MDHHAAGILTTQETHTEDPLLETPTTETLRTEILPHSEATLTQETLDATDQEVAVPVGDIMTSCESAYRSQDS